MLSKVYVCKNYVNNEIARYEGYKAKDKAEHFASAVRGCYELQGYIVITEHIEDIRSNR